MNLVQTSAVSLATLLLAGLSGCASTPSAAPAEPAAVVASAAAPDSGDATELSVEERVPFFVHHARNGECDAVAADLAKGVPVDTVDAVDQTALIAAAGKNQLACTALLLDHGANPNRADPAGWTPLIHAVYFGSSLEMLQLLIDRGAEINAQNARGVTALYLAAATGHAEHVKLLLARGADAALVTQSGYTALRVAQTKGLTQIAALLEQPKVAAKP